MYKFLLLFGMILSFTCLHSQVKNTIPDSTKMVQVQDSVKKKAEQDTTKKETREERKARKKAEKERAKFYYKDILKDSARLEIERLSRIAWKRSLILPGWGQYTNGGLWWIKVPIIYGGFVGGGLTFNYWQWYYKEFLGELQFREKNGQPSNHESLGINSNWDVQGLVKQKDYARRNRDLTILVTLGWYGLNVVEAYVDSILKNRWNISNDLSFKVSPTLIPNYAYTPGMGSLSGTSFVSPGFKMTFSIK